MSLRPLIAIVHYHLRSGGVTKVISQAVKALENSQTDILIFSGSECPFYLPDNCRSLASDKLNYCEGIDANPKLLLEELLKAALDVYGREPDIWHFHNHSIGKNIALAFVAKELADKGKKILFQLHDFPEDRRPLNYSNLLKYTHSSSTMELERILYPQSPNVHYAVLNNRDFSYLSKAGFSQNNLHLLLNPVNLDKSKKKSLTNPFRHKKLWLYPSRCVRRKNVGEFLLWSALADKSKNVFASTLKPTSPADLIPYNRWKSLASDYNLPVEFEIGLKYKNDFSDWIESAWAIMTSSVGEGFGLAFLEPFLFKKPIVGRDIRDITADFKQNGIIYKSLYNEVRFPVDWIGKEILLKTIEIEMRKMYKSYNAEFKDSMPELAYNSAVIDNYADFGRLNEDLQQVVIKKIIARPSLKADISPDALHPEECTSEVLESNYNLTHKCYGLETYRDNLWEIYSSILNSGSSEDIYPLKNTVLEQFLCPEDFYLLRT